MFAQIEKQSPNNRFNQTARSIAVFATYFGAVG
jgi:hypothetical protein